PGGRGWLGRWEIKSTEAPRHPFSATTSPLRHYVSQLFLFNFKALIRQPPPVAAEARRLPDGTKAKRFLAKPLFTSDLGSSYPAEEGRTHVEQTYR
ncbi:hypothetical protein J6590_018063, partial [Homalodisca vitripennis]